MQKLHRRRKAAWLAHAGELGRYKEDNEPSIIFKYMHGKGRGGGDGKQGVASQ